MKYKVTVESNNRIYETEFQASSASEVPDFLRRVCRGAMSVARTLENSRNFHPDDPLATPPARFTMVYEQDTPSDPGEFRFTVSESMFEIAVGIVIMEADAVGSKRAS